MTIPETGSGPEESINLAKLIRLHDMLTIVGMEARAMPLDAAAIEWLVASTGQLLVEVGSAIPASLRGELAGYVARPSDGITEDELRVVRAQLTGWIDGLLTGVSLAWFGVPMPESSASVEPIS